MAVPGGLEDLTYDSSTCARVVIGASRITFTKFSIPKVEVKIEKISPIGAGRATKRTPGKAEVSDLSTEMLATDYKKLLAAQGTHGGTLIEHEITIGHRHPAIPGEFSTLLGACRIISLEGPELDGSEKGSIVKLGWSVMQRWDRGNDRVWKCLSYETTRPSAQARALLEL